MTATDATPSVGTPKPPGQERRVPKPTKTGKIPFTIPSTGDKAETYYELWGELGGNNGKVPLICLHGGPGVPHGYLLPLALFHEDHGIPVLMYDQVGCGESTHFKDKRSDDSFWTPELFMKELDNVKSHLGINEFDIAGQSWGGMLGGQYATTQPAGLRKLILLDSPANMTTWNKVAARQRAASPKDIQEVLDRCEKEGREESEEYENAVMGFYALHLCRLDPWPSELVDVFTKLKDDDTVYFTMMGPNEFTNIGNLKTWTIEEDLKKVTEKTVPGGMLIVNGYYDGAQDECCLPFFNNVSCKVKWITFSMSSHMPHLEETERFLKLVGEFLTS